MTASACENGGRGGDKTSVPSDAAKGDEPEGPGPKGSISETEADAFPLACIPLSCTGTPGDCRGSASSWILPSFIFSIFSNRLLPLVRFRTLVTIEFASSLMFVARFSDTSAILLPIPFFFSARVVTESGKGLSEKGSLSPENGKGAGTDDPGEAPKGLP